MEWNGAMDIDNMVTLLIYRHFMILFQNAPKMSQQM